MSQQNEIRWRIGAAAARGRQRRRVAASFRPPRNKLLILLPAALALSLLAPWAITPLLMIGGAYLCYEGTEKAFEALFPHRAHMHEAQIGSVALNPQTLEDEKVASAIKTDFILSAEIMAITLAAIPATSFISQTVTLAIVAVGITAIVYGGVAIIVKADDLGVALATQNGSSLTSRTLRAVGRGLVGGMPIFLRVLAVVGTAAMVWVGGGILVHGLDEYGFGAIAHGIHRVAEVVAHAVAPLGRALEWLVTATGSGLVGIVVGAALIPAAEHVLAPLWRWVTGRKDAAQESRAS